MDKLKKICYIVIAICIILLGIKALKQANGETVKYLQDNLVMVTDGKYHEENDGKVVAISGNLGTEDYVEDERFGIWAENSARLERKVLEYRYYNSNSESHRDDSSTVGSVWKKRWEDKSTVKQFVDNDIYQVVEVKDILTEDESIEDVNEEKFMINPKLNGIFEIPADALLKFPCNNPVKVEVDEGDPLDQEYYIENYDYNFIVKNNEFTTVIDGEPLVGDIRVSYSSLDLEKLGPVTVVAKQENGKLVDYVGENQDIVFEVFKGHLSHDEIIGNMKQDEKYTIIGVSVTFIILAIVGMFIFRDNISCFMEKKNIKINISDNVIAFLIMLAFIAFLIVTILLGVKLIKDTIRANKATPITASVISYRDEYHGDEIAYYYTYEYVVDGEAYQREFNNVSKIPFDIDKETDDGSIAQLEVYYEKDNPSKSYTIEEKNPDIFLCFVLIFFIALFTFATVKCIFNIKDNIKKGNK